MTKLCMILGVIFMMLSGGCNSVAKRESGRGAFAHAVFFKLKDNSPAKQQELIEECYVYLKGHSGVLSFYAGKRAAEMDRQVNVKDFDVSLHIIFKDISFHDDYQVAEKHHEFVDRNKDNWEHVRVFDSYVY